MLRCLAKNPADRPQSAHALAEEFLQALAESPGAAWPGGAIPRVGAHQPEASPPPRTESPYSPYEPVEPSPSQAAATEDADRVGYQPVSIDSTLVPGMYSQPQFAPPVLSPKKAPADGLATEYPRAQPGVQVRRKAPWKGIALALALAGIARWRLFS